MTLTTKRIMPKVESRLRYVDHVEANGNDFFSLACAEDLEGVVAKWKFGTYSTDPQRTSWLKIKNPIYSQAEAEESYSTSRGGNQQRQRIKQALALR